MAQEQRNVDARPSKAPRLNVISTAAWKRSKDFPRSLLPCHVRRPRRHELEETRAETLPLCAATRSSRDDEHGVDAAVPIRHRHHGCEAMPQAVIAHSALGGWHRGSHG